MSAQPSGHFPVDSVRGYPLLVVIDPVARSTDGEAVRIAKDVLCAGAGAKICLPEGPEEFARMLARRGQRRPVVIGDDRALLRVVGLLHKERELAGVPLSMVPVGPPAAVALSRALGIPTDTVAAARAVLDGGERPMDLLTDDSDGIVLGSLRIPCGSGTVRPGRGASVPRQSSPADPVAARGGPVGPVEPAGGDRPWWKPYARTARTALSLLAAPAAGLRPSPGPATTAARAGGGHGCRGSGCGSRRTGCCWRIWTGRCAGCRWCPADGPGRTGPGRAPAVSWPRSWCTGRAARGRYASGRGR